MRLGRDKQTQDDAQIDMTPMLDIVFIMLIFFIVTSSFINQSGIEVEQPQAATGVSQKKAVIYIGITAANEIYIDNKMVDQRRVQADVARLLLEQPNGAVVIQADRFAFNGTVIAVMDAAKRAGVSNIALATEPR